jgi:hypothetical protein
MTIYTFPAGQSPQVLLAGCAGKLTIDTWNERTVAFESEMQLEGPTQEGEAIVLRGAQGDLQLRVPADTTISIADQRGDVTVRGVRALTLERAEGAVRIGAISGAVRLRDIYGVTRVDGAGMLVIERDEQWRQCRERIRRDIEAYNIGMLEIAEASDNLTIVGAQQASVGSVGGDAIARIVAGDLRVGDVGGSFRVAEVGGHLYLGNIGGNCTVRQVAGDLGIGHVGGTADLAQIGAVLRIGDVGGNLTLDAAPLMIETAPESGLRVAIGGNAQLELPARSNLTIQVIAGGVVRGEGLGSTLGGGMATIVYGDGAAQLDLIVGGNLTIREA